MTLTRKLTAGAAAIIATLGLAALAPAEAEAASCGAQGKHLHSFPLTSPTNGKKIGSLDVYYNGRYGGTNIACLHHYGDAWGWTSTDYVRITRCDSYYGCDTLDYSNTDYDVGDYKYYAGPVRATATRYRCVSAYAAINDPYDQRKRTSITVDNIGCAAQPKLRP